MRRDSPPKSTRPYSNLAGKRVQIYTNSSGWGEEEPTTKGCGEDNFHGILKKVSEMKFRGSLDSYEPSTASEKSDPSDGHCRTRIHRRRSSHSENGENSIYDESSGSSLAGSDRCPPYEEIAERNGSYREENYENLPRTPESVRIPAPEDQSAEEGITDTERHQIETFFCGLRTDLFVCPSLANMYVGWCGSERKWTFKHTGIPLILHDRGDTKSRTKKRIQIILAERGTCFPLWRDTIDNLTSYKKAGDAFHTMHLSSDHTRVIGLSFDSAEESDRFYDKMNRLTSDPENINISVPSSRNGRKPSARRRTRLPHKDQISNPCLFEHVTSVAAKDAPMYTSLQTLLDKEVVKEGANIC